MSELFFVNEQGKVSAMLFEFVPHETPLLWLIISHQIRKKIANWSPLHMAFILIPLLWSCTRHNKVSLKSHCPIGQCHFALVVSETLTIGYRSPLIERFAKY